VPTFLLNLFASVLQEPKRAADPPPREPPGNEQRQ